MRFLVFVLIAGVIQTEVQIGKDDKVDDPPKSIFQKIKEWVNPRTVMGAVSLAGLAYVGYKYKQYSDGEREAIKGEKLVLLEEYFKTYQHEHVGFPLNRVKFSTLYNLDKEHPHLIRRFMEYALMSYCGKNSTIFKLANNNLRMGSFETSYIRYDREENTRLVFSVNNEQESIVVSIRGTSNFDDTLVDLQWGTMPTTLNINHRQYFGDFPDGSSIHSGFLHRFMKFREFICKQTRELIKKYPSYPVIVTGHSLGGSHSVLQAAYMNNIGFNISAVYTYGQPKVGNQLIVDHLSHLLNYKIYRINTKNDVVQRMGPNWRGGYHSKKDYNVVLDHDSMGSEEKALFQKDIDPENRWVFEFGPRDHVYYLSKSFRNEFLCSLEHRIPDEIYSREWNHQKGTLRFRQKQYHEDIKKSDIKLWGSLNVIQLN